MRAVRSGAVALFVCALLLASTAHPVVAADDRRLTAIYPIPTPVVQLDLNVTVVMAGIGLNATEQASVERLVAATWWPFVTSLATPLGVNYTVRLHLVNASSAFLSGYALALHDSLANDSLGYVVGRYIGLWENLSKGNFGYSNLTPVRHADADAMTAWLSEAHQEFPELEAPSSAARLFFLSPPMREPYYYSVNSTDVDRRENFTYETLNAWGDANGVFFQDLRANPNHLGEGSPGRPANFEGMPPLWSYGTSLGERTRLVSDLALYIDSAVKTIIAPSYVVAPYFPASLTLDTTIFDATSSQSLFAPGGAGSPFGINASSDVLNPTLVEKSLHDLVPFAPVSVRVRLANNATDPDIASAVRLDTSSDSAGDAVLNPFSVANDLSAKWNVPKVPVAPGDAVTVPALLVIYDRDAWVSSSGTRGVTLQRNDGRAAGIVVAEGLGQLKTRGFSETLIHEGGHSLGLGHPHEIGVVAPDGSALFLIDWMHTSSSTPMTYLPAYVDYSFDAFDRRALWFGAAAATLGSAFILRQQAYERLASLHYNLSTLPASIRTNESFLESYANETRNLLAGGVLYIEPAAPFSAGGAIVMAKRAFDAARSILLIAYLQPVCCPGPLRNFLPGPNADLALGALALGVVIASASRWHRRDR